MMGRALFLTRRMALCSSRCHCSFRSISIPSDHRNLNVATSMWQPEFVPHDALRRNRDPNAVFVIQGASRGIGLEMSRLCLERVAGIVVATCRSPESAVGLQKLQRKLASPKRLKIVKLDLQKPCTTNVDIAAKEIREIGGGRVDTLINVAGVLHEEENMPERSISAVSESWFHHSLQINTVGPFLLMQALSPMMRVKNHGKSSIDERPPTMIANISARVGSIEDNRLGGWYSYRISKAALNQATKTTSLELQRHNCCVIAVHPGTVKTGLSQPFVKRMKTAVVGEENNQLRPADVAARQILDLIDGATSEDSGKFWAWDGEQLPF